MQMKHATSWRVAIRTLRTGMTGSVELHAAVLDSNQLKDEQSAILARAVFFFAVLGLGSVNLFMFDFRRQSDLFMLLAYGWIVLSYLGWGAAAIDWLRFHRNDRFIAISSYLVIGLGAAWGLLINLFSMAATPDQKGLLIGLIMALVSTPMLGVPAGVGLAFWFPIAVFCSLAMLYTLQPLHAVAAIFFVAFLAFSLAGLLFLNKIILERSIGRINLQHQHKALGIFLREYEQNASDWLWETDTHDRLHNITARMAQVFGRERNALEGLSIERLVKAPAGRSGPGSSANLLPDGDHALSVALQRKVAFRDLLMMLETAQGDRWLSLTGHPVFDDYSGFCGFRGVGADITDAKQSQDRIELLAGHDGLTGLANRQSFLDRCEQACRDAIVPATVPAGVPSGAAVAMVPDPRFALLLIDIDRFKSINDDYGHAAGDMVLVTIADRLREAIRPVDLAARLGGDEFAVLLRISFAEAVAEVTERLLQALRTRISFSGILIQPSASIGIALFPHHTAKVAKLMKHADLALYEAKHQGRNRCCFFEDGMDEAYDGRLRLQADLGLALERRELFVAYQPIFDIHGGRIVSAEALVRWRHAIRGIVPAADFIPLAEETGLIDSIGAFVLREACRAAMAWDMTVPVVVNLSLRQLKSNHFLETLRACLEETALPPARLGLEITETVFMALGERTIRQIDAIRGLGVRVIMDDFGTGYSSLTYLRTLDFDGLKIDAAFTRDLPDSRKVVAIVRTIVRLASELGMSLIAEGVESREQLVWLRANGVNLAQGFLLAKPQPASQIMELLAAGGGAGHILREL